MHENKKKQSLDNYKSKDEGKKYVFFLFSFFFCSLLKEVKPLNKFR